MRKVKKNLKGMTLYEMIISIAVFALMAGVLVGVGTHVDRTTRAANNMKNKLVQETPYAANKITIDPSTGDEKFSTEDLDMTFSMHVANNKWYDHTTRAEIQNDNPSCTINLRKHNTEAAVTGDKDTHLDPNSDNAHLNLQFLETLPETP